MHLSEKNNVCFVPASLDDYSFVRNSLLARKMTFEIEKKKKRLGIEKSGEYNRRRKMSRDVEQRRTEVVDELVVIVVDIIVNLVMVNYFDVASKRM